MADGWDIIGALSGAGGTLAAALAIWQSGAQSKAQAVRDEANALRQEIRSYKASVDRLVPSMLRGETLLSVSENVAQSFYQHFKITDAASLEAAMDAMTKRISLLVRWIENDPAANAFKQERLTLQAVDSYLGARLPIFAEVTALLNAIASDGMSAIFFMNFFKPEMRALMFRDLGSDAKGWQIETALASEMSSNAALYFGARYERALKVIDSFVEELERAHLTLQDSQFRSLATRAQGAPRAETHTDSIRNYLKIATPYFGRTKTKALLEMVDTLETAISKEAAKSEASRIKAQAD